MCVCVYVCFYILVGNSGYWLVLSGKKVWAKPNLPESGKRQPRAQCDPFSPNSRFLIPTQP
jgi:hypothetical protein